MTFVLVAGITNRVITWPCGARYEAGFWEERFEPATDIGELDAVRKNVERFMGDDMSNHEDEPDSHPTEEPPKERENV